MKNRYKFGHLIALCFIALMAYSFEASAADTKAQAYSKCSADASKYQPADTNLITSPGTCVEKVQPNGGPFYQCQYQAASYYQGPVGTVTCGDYAYDDVPNQCASKPALTSGWAIVGNGSSCQDGCSYGPGTSSETYSAGGLTYASMAGAKPTGASCTYGDGSGQPITKDQCVTQGSLTQCVKADGTHCAVSSSGKQFCWGATEAGTKSSGNEGATKSPVGTNINAPNTKPSNGGDWQQSGQGTSSSSSGGNTTNYNITNWTSSYGSQGNGNGNGNSEGDGEGDGDGDGDGDSPGQGMGDFYQKSDKTVASVFADFKGKIGDAPLFKSATSFLGGCSGGGQCPNETWDGGQYAGKFDLSQLCSGALGTLMNFAGFVFLAAMGAVGFRWALL